VATFDFLILTYYFLFSQPDRNSGRPLRLWLKIYLLSCLFLLSIFQLSQIKFTANPFQSFCSNYPCAAVDFLRNQPSYYLDNIFNEYGWGGYLIWVDPARKLFIDGRLPQVEFAGHTYLEEYYEFFKKEENIGAQLDKYKINLILFPAKDTDLKAKKWERIFFGIRNEELIAHNYLRDYLATASNWQPIYSDQTAIIYKREY
jgi:hypothetical protein